jgi:glycosyltransferase involved in cell wall biosynthesis
MPNGLLTRLKARLEPSGEAGPVRTIAVCAAQIPFFKGGAEAHVNGLVRELAARHYEVDLINIPYKWYPRDQLLKSLEVWRLLDLSESNGKKIDLLITTKFPSYFADHSRKVLWLFHQYRHLYDLWGTPYSDFDPAQEADRRLRDQLVDLDTEVLRSYKRIYTNAKNTAARLKKYNGIDAVPLYHPPHLAGRFYAGEDGGYILSVGRLDRLKRVDLLVRSVRLMDRRIRCRIAGTGPEMESLQRTALDAGVADRVEFLGFVPEDELPALYANATAVYFAPWDEDYGYVTLEAFLSQKPVITAADSGGPLEFVEDAQNGLVLQSADEKELAQRSEQLFFDKEKCRSYGRAGYERVKDISWDTVIKTLVGG